MGSTTRLALPSSKRRSLLKARSSPWTARPSTSSTLPEPVVSGIALLLDTDEGGRGAAAEAPAQAFYQPVQGSPSEPSRRRVAASSWYSREPRAHQVPPAWWQRRPAGVRSWALARSAGRRAGYSGRIRVTRSSITAKRTAVTDASSSWPRLDEVRRRHPQVGGGPSSGVVLITGASRASAGLVLAFGRISGWDVV